MKLLDTRKTILLCAIVTAVLLLPACDRYSTDNAEASVLRVHDVSGLQIDGLEEKLNELLSREDLPLRGKVKSLDESRLAVNASSYLQGEIAAMIDKLRADTPAGAIQRPFRVEFWLLRMAKGEGAGDVPEYVVDDLAPLLAKYEGYGLSVYDYLESFHSGLASVGHIRSGNTNVYFDNVASLEDEIVLNAGVRSRAESGGSISFEINHALEPGKSLVLGRVHDGGGAGEASYQVLVARAEWTSSTD